MDNTLIRIPSPTPGIVGLHSKHLMKYIAV